MKTGSGYYQQHLQDQAQKQVFLALTDKGWHRYSEIKKKTKMSSATLSKHLRELKKLGVLEKEVDITSGEYPYPVRYKVSERGCCVVDYAKELSDYVMGIADILDSAKNGDEYLDTMTLFFQTGMLLLIKYKRKLGKDPNVMDLVTMHGWFMELLDKGIEDFVRGFD